MRQLKNVVFLLLVCCMHLLFSVCSVRAVGEEQILFNAMNRGTCKKMVGRVQVLGVFVDTEDEAWTEEKKLEKKNELYRAGMLLESQALSYGKSLRFSFTYIDLVTAKNPYNQDASAWADECLMNNKEFMLQGAKLEGKENQLTVFLIASDGRSVASRDGYEYPEEFALTYEDDVAENYMHEMLHLFGAKDFYYHDAYKTAARTYFPESIMLATNEGNTVDGLTAYLIGWTDELTGDAAAFVNDTKHVTKKEMDAALAQTMKDGYSMTENDGNLYWGQLEDGLKTGYGVFRWKDGNCYLGEFRNGSFHGFGIMEWKSGERYIGDYLDGKRTGNGCMLWNDETFYVGGYESGERSGRGILHHNNGDIQIGNLTGNTFDDGYMYIRKKGEEYDQTDALRQEKIGATYYGETKNGIMHGYGMLIWDSGEIYVGQFKNGIQDGLGIMQWVDGTRYLGKYKNGTRNGTGAYIWPDNDVYVGRVLDGKMDGNAVLKYFDASCYIGSFKDNMKSGEGMRVWPGGEIYIGSYANDTMNGNGVYTDSDGNMFDGLWENGQFVSY